MEDLLDEIETVKQKKGSPTFIFVILQSFFILGGFIASIIEIKSILFSGSTVLLFSIATLVVSMLKRVPFAIWKSGLNILTAISGFLVILLFNLGP